MLRNTFLPSLAKGNAVLNEVLSLNAQEFLWEPRKHADLIPQ